MFKVEICSFFQNRVSQKLRVMATNGLRFRVQGDKLEKYHPVDIAKQKKSFILLDCDIQINGGSTVHPP